MRLYLKQNLLLMFLFCGCQLSAQSTKDTLNYIDTTFIWTADIFEWKGSNESKRNKYYEGKEYIDRLWEVYIQNEANPLDRTDWELTLIGKDASIFNQMYKYAPTEITTIGYVIEVRKFFQKNQSTGETSTSFDINDVSFFSAHAFNEDNDEGFLYLSAEDLEGEYNKQEKKLRYQINRHLKSLEEAENRRTINSQSMLDYYGNMTQGTTYEFGNTTVAAEYNVPQYIVEYLGSFPIRDTNKEFVVNHDQKQNVLPLLVDQPTASLSAYISLVFVFSWNDTQIDILDASLGLENVSIMRYESSGGDIYYTVDSEKSIDEWEEEINGFIE